ncbi:RNA polymerase sigma factor, partial [uncultured Lutibacter sp.]|uniref:RNA polymerase sigma factor n=1 Tax=uncultured Lutibacter sp. TaxID=437739 RepID=UPI002605F897
MNKEAEFIRDLIDTNQSDKAFKKLLDLYQERLYWHIRKIVITHENADDVLQNTFIRVYKGLPNFKQKSSLHTWMYRIAYNESIRYLEQNKNNQQDSLDDVNKTY